MTWYRWRDGSGRLWARRLDPNWEFAQCRLKAERGRVAIQGRLFEIGPLRANPGLLK